MSPALTKKDRPLTEAHFAGFEKAIGTNPNGTSKREESERFRRSTSAT
jgi:type I restriction enzyme M protein